MKKCIFFICIMAFVVGLFAEKVILNPGETEAMTFKIIDDQDDHTIYEITINYYHLNDVDIDGVGYKKIRVPSGSSRLERGNPELPMIGRSMIIPHNAKMNVQIISTKFDEFDGRIAPSRCSFSRNIVEK